LACATLSVGLYCQTPLVQSANETKRSAIIAGIQNGDEAQILQAGQSGDRSVVPYLREQLKKSKDKIGGPASRVQIALAKLDETKELQEVFCEIDYGDYAVSKSAIETKLPYIKGWYSAEIISGILDHRFAKDPKVPKHYADDLGVIPLSQLLLTGSISRIFPDAPTQGALGGTSPDLWRQYVKDHRSELMTMRPLAERVYFSASACKDGRPRH